jgi:hypothetical protein
MKKKAIEQRGKKRERREKGRKAKSIHTYKITYTFKKKKKKSKTTVSVSHAFTPPSFCRYLPLITPPTNKQTKRKKGKHKQSPTLA